MNNEKLLSSVVELLRHDFNSELSMNEPIRIKSSPHQLAVRIHELAEKDGSVWVHTDEGWHRLEASDINANLVLSSIYQRLRFLSSKNAVA